MVCRHIKRELLLWLACASLVGALAAAEVKPGTRANAQQTYRITPWTSEDGLPANHVTALAQSRDGYLWVGTWFGLVRFDGVRFTVFNRYNTPAMVNDVVAALAEDSEGNLWIGTADGLLVLRDGRFKRFTEADGLPGQKVWRLIASRAGGVWMQAGGSSGKYDKLTHWPKEEPTVAVDLRLEPLSSVRSLWENDDGSLTVVTRFGLRRVSRQGELSEEPSPPGAPAGAWVGGCLIDRQKRYWLSLEARLSQFSQGAWHVVQQPTTRADSGHFLYEDRASRVWVSRGQAGFWRCDGDRVESVKLDERREDQEVECIIEDREGNVWIGTSHGLYQLRSKLIRAFSAADGLPSDECWSVCEASDGAIWVETKGGAARIKNEQAQTFADQPSPPHGMSILTDFQGTLWLGNWESGLVAWRLGVETNYFWPSGRVAALPSLGLDSLYLDRAGRVWVGTDHGVTWFENRQPAAHWGEFGLPTNGVRSIYQTRDGTMWFGTWQAGAVRWKGSTKSEIRNPKSEMNQSLLTSAATRLTTADGLADNRVFVFHEDAEGALWIGTHNGLNRFKDGRFFTFRTEHGLLDSLINWLEEDDFGRLWFSCNRGIFRIDRTELNAVADGKKTRANVAVYGTADGMLSPETNGEHQPAGCKDREGKLWFPTMQGVVVIDPRTLTDNDVPPPVVIEQVKADEEIIFGDDVAADVRRLTSNSRNLKSITRNDQSLLTSAATRLGSGRARTLQIRYTANSFADPRRVRFRYRLTGHEDKWREETTERVAYYAGLRPGDYRFEVKAANPHGVWSEKGASFAFSLAPKFTQTIWFPVSCALGLLTVSGALAAWRLRWQRRASLAEQSLAVERERTRIANDLHDELGARLTALAMRAELAGSGGRTVPDEQTREFARDTRGLAERLRDVVWAADPTCDSLEGLAAYLTEYAETFLEAVGVHAWLDVPEMLPPVMIGAEARHHLVLVAKEALNNAVKHAHPTEVTLKLAVADGHLLLSIRDNGAGFDENMARRDDPKGLASMRTRVEKLGGTIRIETATGKGTTVEARVPLDKLSEKSANASNAGGSK